MPSARLTINGTPVNILETKQASVFRDQVFLDANEITRLKEGYDYIASLFERGMIDPQYLTGGERGIPCCYQRSGLPRDMCLTGEFFTA